MGTALGLDLALRTGSLVQIRVDEQTNAIDGCNILASWNKGPKIKDPLLTIAKFFEHEVLRHTPKDRKLSVAIDWNQKEIYWSANKANSNVKTFIAGYLFARYYDYGVTPVFIEPKSVRQFFGFSSQKVPKEEVQRHFLTHVPRISTGTDLKYLGYDKRTEHDLDALILAYIQELKWRKELCPYAYRVKSQW